MARATENTFYRTLVLRMAGMMSDGSSLTAAMKIVKHFPANLRDLVKVGEQTGELGLTLEKIGHRYEKIMQQRIDRIMALVPVIIITGLGAIVGLVGWSIMSGIFQAITASKATTRTRPSQPLRTAGINLEAPEPGAVALLIRFGSGSLVKEPLIKAD